MDVTQLLFEDVRRVPIIARRSQEMWLGIQIKAPQIWTKYRSYSSRTLSTVVCAELSARIASLDQNRYVRNGSLPRLQALPAEAWDARKHIHTLTRSRLHQFAKAADAIRGDETKRKLISVAFEIAELSALLPDSILKHLSSSIQQTANWPTGPCLEAWFDRLPDDSAWEAIDERARVARQLFVEGYLRYAMRIAASSIGRGLDYPDLVQEGVLGLMKAADRFDYRTGARFAVFATTWIWQSTNRAIADQGRTIRLPVHMHERVQSIHKHLQTTTTEDQLIAAIMEDLPVAPNTVPEENEMNAPGQGASISSSAARVRRRARQIMEYCQPFIPLSLEFSLDNGSCGDHGNEGMVTLADCIADESQDLEMNQRQEALCSVVRTLLRSASDKAQPRDLEILCQKYGLVDGYEQTLEEVGQRFGLTRERIRQIEQRVLAKLEASTSTRFREILLEEERPAPLLPFTIQRYLQDRFGPWRALPDLRVERERYRVDCLLTSLPAGDLRVSTASGESGRNRQIETVLRLLSGPAHYTTITDQLNDISDDGQLDPGSVYNLMKRHESVYALLGEGVFSLVEWELRRASATEPVLPYCPAPPPDPPGEPDSFFECVVESRRILVGGCNPEAFLRSLSAWAGLSWPQPPYVCQSMLSACFLVGVIPYMLYAERKDILLSLTLPDSDLHTLRHFCLDSLSRRLQAMPEFWWLVRCHQPIRITELAQMFVRVHPFGLDDVANRLQVLSGVGALRRSSSGRYSLTPLGEEVAERWAHEPQEMLGRSAPTSLEEDLDVLGWDE